MNKWLLPAVLLALVAAGVILLRGITLKPSTAKAAPPSIQPGPKVKEWLPAEMKRVLAGADRLEVLRLKFNSQNPEKPYDIIASGPEWPVEKLDEFKKWALDDASYRWGVPKDCKPMPGVLFKVSSGKEYVEFLVCFECDMLSLVLRDAAGKQVARAHNDFDPSRAKLLEWAQQAFPNDTAIMALKAKR